MFVDMAYILKCSMQCQHTAVDWKLIIQHWTHSSMKCSIMTLQQTHSDNTMHFTKDNTNKLHITINIIVIGW